MKLPSRRVDVAAGELVLVGKSDAVGDEIERVPAAASFGEHRIDGRGIGHVAMADDEGPSSAASGSTRFLRASPW